MDRYGVDQKRLSLFILSLFICSFSLESLQIHRSVLAPLVGQCRAGWNWISEFKDLLIHSMQKSATSPNAELQWPEPSVLIISTITVQFVRLTLKCNNYDWLWYYTCLVIRSVKQTNDQTLSTRSHSGTPGLDQGMIYKVVPSRGFVLVLLEKHVFIEFQNG